MSVHATRAHFRRYISSLTFYDWLGLIALATAIIPLFAYLAQPPIFIWDEAIYALNSLDVHDTGDLIIMRRNGQLTFYNTKPPLVIWLQALSIGIFGANEFAIRFPSAMAGLMTCAMMLIFSRKTLGDIRIGIVAVLVLISSYGYVMPHVTRTGDLDAMLAMWVTLYVLLALHYFFTRPREHRRQFWAIGLALAAAFYTKSVAGFLALPGLALVALLYGQLLPVLRKRLTYLVAGVTTGICLLYYAIRETVSRGYLERVLHSEYNRFTSDVMPWFDHPWYFYLDDMWHEGKFNPWLYALPVMIIAGMVSRRRRRQTLALCMIIAAFLVVISYPQVKLRWYDAPLYPLLSLLLGIGATVSYTWIEDKWKLPRVVFPILVAGISIWPLLQIHERNAQRTGPESPLEAEGYMLREYLTEASEPRHIKVLMIYNQYAHYAQADFYINAFNRHSPHVVSLHFSPEGIHPGDTVLCCQQEHLDSLRARWSLDTLYEKHLRSISEREVTCRLVVVSGPG